MAQRIGGLAAIFLEESKVLKAAQKTREMGFEKFDAISPYPIHGMEEAAGIKRSTIPYVTFIAGLTGLISGLLLTWWTSAVDWPLNVGGKPFFSLPAFIPIIFELTILFAALASVGALFFHCKMPQIDPPVIDPDLTCSKFAIFVPSNDRGYNEALLEKTFRDLGAVEVKKVAEY
ncbi:MAG: DUF3341 domain-containing protein [Pseudobdellovibrionaceae bacterium]